MKKGLLKKLFNTILHPTRRSKIIEYAIFAISGVLLLSGIFLWWLAKTPVPDLNTISERRVAQSTKIFDKTGTILLYEVHRDISRNIVESKDIPASIKNAVVSIEDTEFYNHKGIRITSIIRSILANITGVGFHQGGSTITQQVVKLTILTIDKTPARKLREWVLALKLERKISKDEILTIYLNEAPFGGTIYGIEEAARVFFGKELKNVTLGESAYLAALPQAPTFYSPFGKNKDALTDRKNLVLRKMFELKYISEEEYKKAVEENVVFLAKKEENILAPHFSLMVKEYLEETYGQEMMEKRGFNVITTLDYELQEKAEDIVKKYALENEKNFNASNAGLVAIEPKTGEIITMVGSRDYFDPNIDGNFNITLAKRQPGSVFKPIVYATAFNKGYTPDTVVFDVKTEFSTNCTPWGSPQAGYSSSDCYSPDNYDNVFRGPITLRNALAQSVNVPAVKVLYLVGLKDALRVAKDLGIRSLGEAKQYGLTLVLGGGEITLVEAVSAYSVFGNEGTRVEPNFIKEIKDFNGEIIEKQEIKTTTALPAETTRKISNILSDNEARTPAFGARSPLYFEGRQVAAKTGTTNDYKDAWVVGYTPSIAVGAWAGNNDNTSMEKKVAGLIIAPMWHEVMEQVLKKYPNETFNLPEPTPENTKPILRGIWRGGDSFVIDTVSGKLATDLTPKETKEEKIIGKIEPILFWVDRENPTRPAPLNPENDPQFSLWRYPVKEWAKSHGFLDDTSISKPTETDNVHTLENKPTITISGLSDGASYNKTNLPLTISTTAKYPVSRIDVFINNSPVVSSKQGNFSTEIKQKDLVTGENSVSIIVVDSIYNRSEKTINFKVN